MTLLLAQRAVPAQLYPGEDSVSVQGMRSGLKVYAGYIAGTFTNYNSVRSAFPGALYVGIVPRIGLGVRYDCADVETGDMTPAEAPEAFAEMRGRTINVVRPMFYANGSTMPSVVNALTGAGIMRTEYLLWRADWNGSPSIPAGFDAAQYASNASFDADTFESYCFGSAVVPTPPADPDHIDIDGYEVRKPGDGMVPAVVSWWGVEGETTRQANIPQALWNQIKWSQTQPRK
jgi:hypothetical protein